MRHGSAKISFYPMPDAIFLARSGAKLEMISHDTLSPKFQGHLSIYLFVGVHGVKGSGIQGFEWNAKELQRIESLAKILYFLSNVVSVP